MEVRNKTQSVDEPVSSFSSLITFAYETKDKKQGTFLEMLEDFVAGDRPMDNMKEILEKMKTNSSSEVLLKANEFEHIWAEQIEIFIEDNKEIQFPLDKKNLLSVIHEMEKRFDQLIDPFIEELKKQFSAEELSSNRVMLGLFKLKQGYAFNLLGSVTLAMAKESNLGNVSRLNHLYYFLRAAMEERIVHPNLDTYERFILVLRNKFCELAKVISPKNHERYIATFDKELYLEMLLDGLEGHLQGHFPQENIMKTKNKDQMLQVHTLLRKLSTANVNQKQKKKNIEKRFYPIFAKKIIKHIISLNNIDFNIVKGKKLCDESDPFLHQYITLDDRKNTLLDVKLAAIRKLCIRARLHSFENNKKRIEHFQGIMNSILKGVPIELLNEVSEIFDEELHFDEIITSRDRKKIPNLSKAKKTFERNGRILRDLFHAIKGKEEIRASIEIAFDLQRFDLLPTLDDFGKKIFLQKLNQELNPNFLQALILFLVTQINHLNGHGKKSDYKFIQTMISLIVEKVMVGEITKNELREVLHQYDIPDIRNMTLLGRLFNCSLGTHSFFDEFDKKLKKEEKLEKRLAKKMKLKISRENNEKRSCKEKFPDVQTVDFGVPLRDSLEIYNPHLLFKQNKIYSSQAATDTKDKEKVIGQKSVMS